MQIILERVSNWLKQKADPREGVRFALKKAAQWTAESAGDIVIRPADDSSSAMHCRVLAVRQESFIITLPVIGKETQRLGTNQLLVIELADEGREPRFGECRVINRVRFTTADGTRQQCYRVSVPERLFREEKRKESRLNPIDYLSPDGNPIECELLQLGCSPIRGVVLDISATGAKLRSRNAIGRVEPDSRMYFKASFPKPLGSLNEQATVIRVERAPQGDMTFIGIRFVTPLAALKGKRKLR